MDSQELREKFLKFYRDRGHQEVPQASLVPEQDTSVLFTTAGMHPLIPYLLGDIHPDGTRLVNIQRSLRTTDIEEVGDATHSTVFEMLGHWSLGDYFKDEAIQWSYEFVTDILGFSQDRLAVTLFEGDVGKGIPYDTEAETIWKKLGMERIVPLGSPNFWSPVHATGPCGPTTEIFVYIGAGSPAADSKPGGPKDHEWVEIWNNVFMEYNKTANDRYEPLDQKNIDTGVGFERVLMVVNGLESIYETDLYRPMVAAVSEDLLAHRDRHVRIIVDHVKAAVFLIADGVLPTNKDRGSILRRLIRRAVHAAQMIGFTNWPLVIEAAIGTYAKYYPYLEETTIEEFFMEEVRRFTLQLDAATRFVQREMNKHPVQSEETAARLAFLAYQSHALPAEIAWDLISQTKPGLDRARFEEFFHQQFATHQAVSAQGSEKKFGGHGLLLDTGELKAKDEAELERVLSLHTATHLLQAGLRQVLGPHVEQKGSDITPDRLRFDFTHPGKLTPDELKAVQDWINERIRQDLPVQWVELPLAKAQASGALHFFKHKYPPSVKVYFVGEDLGQAISKEFCGGPHVDRTGRIGRIRIVKDESAGAGIRRIRAVLEDDQSNMVS